MKRLTVVLSVLLVFIMSAGALAALSTDIKGFVEMDLTYMTDDPDDADEPYYLRARGRGRATLSMSSGSSGNPKVTIGMKSADTGDMKDDTWINFTAPLSRTSNMPFNIESMRLEATGAYWKNGPSLKTSIGTYNVNWNQYTAHRLGRNLIRIQNAAIGPVKLEGIYAWTQSESRYNKVAGYTAALRATGKLDPVNFDVTVTNAGSNQTDSDLRHTNYTFQVDAAPVNGLDLSGVVSLDGDNDGMLYKVEAKLSSIDNLTLTGLVGVTDDKYNPSHTETHNDHRIWWRDETRYAIDAETVQAGVKLSGGLELKGKHSVDETDTIIRAAASTTIEGFDLGVELEQTAHHDDTASNETILKAGKKFGNVDFTYKGTMETDRDTVKDMINEFEVKTKVNTLIADNISLKAKAILEGDEDAKYGAIAEWRLPNGLDAFVGYANFNYSGDNWVNLKQPDGFFIRLHRRITF